MYYIIYNSLIAPIASKTVVMRLATSIHESFYANNTINVLTLEFPSYTFNTGTLETQEKNSEGKI